MNSPSLRYHIAAAVLIVVSVTLHLAYLICDCPLDLAPDEAHYWHWSRRIDWSYYSKGPLVAWLIRGSCELFGGLSVQLVGTEMLAVRLPAVASHAVLLAGLYMLAADALRSARAGLAVVALALTMPPVTAAAVVMTIDPPFLACWCWALVSVRRATCGRSYWWVFAGVCGCLGVLAKYPMLLLPLAVAAFLLVRCRDEFRRPGFWLFVALTLFGCVPIVLWNWQHEWVSLRHVLGQAGVGGEKQSALRWHGPFIFASSQFALLLGFWFVAFAAAGWRFRRTSDTGLSLLWWSSVPVWGVFATASLFAEGQVNWPAAAYVGGLVLAVAWVRTQLAHPAWRPLLAIGLGFATILGLGLSLVAHFPGLVREPLAAIAGPPTEKNPAPLRKLDPTCRLRGWRTLAREVDAIRDRVTHETGHEPVLAAMVWTTPGELSFYCRDHPEAYSFGLALADRHSQYDVWRPNPVSDGQAFRSRSVVYVGDEIPTSSEIFERVEPPLRVVHTEHSVPVAVWTVWVGHGFRGFTRARVGATRARY